MKPFNKIAVPNEDIVEGRLTMDVFAADLWQVVEGKAHRDYQDAKTFFKKTYLTKGLGDIIKMAKNRLDGKGGDAVIQLQTPFGGGKTHTLIALYHKAKEWGVKVFVFVGTALDPKDIRPWEELEKQLTGKVEKMKGDNSPGKAKLIELLSQNSPVLILMDEVLAYIIKASAIKVGKSDLASQTLVFIQELSEAVAVVGNACLVLTLPSSILEHYDANAEQAFQKLQKITGRVEKILTPVADDEIEYVIRARLFRGIDEKEADKIIDEFVEYARKEGILSKDELDSYRKRFQRSYPFKPEVIDVLYKRWGSFPKFQRTRGVLRLLSLVVHDSLYKGIPFIRLSDFNLSNDNIKVELVNYIGQEYNSVIANDIISPDSGAKKVDEEMGGSLRVHKLGTAVSTTIFMMSFSGRGERGCSIKEIKLSVATPEINSAVIDTVINNLKEKLFYLSDDGLYFTNQPNLNKIIIDREENISNDEISQEEKTIMTESIHKTPFKLYLYPKFPRDVPDTPELKFIVLNKEKPNNEILEKSGENPRVYRNTLIFLCIDENRREEFHSYLRKLLALRSIEKDTKLNLTEEQKKQVQNKLKDLEDGKLQKLRDYYRIIYLPIKDNFKQLDMGISTSFEKKSIIEEAYDYLKSYEEIVEKLSPKVILDKYLVKNDYVDVKKLYDTLLNTPGELRLSSKDVLINAIKEGVKEGLFGFGYLHDEKIDCKYIEEEPSINLTEGEIIIKPDLCKKETLPILTPPTPTQEEQPITKESITPPEDYYSTIKLWLKVPPDQISTIARILSFLKDKFHHREVEIIISLKEGKLKINEYEEKILQTLTQARIEIKEEKEE